MPQDKQVVIVGAGYGGLPLANKLRRAAAKFTLISPGDACHLNLASIRAAVKPSMYPPYFDHILISNFSF